MLKRAPRGALCLSASYLQLGLALLVYLGQADHEDAVLFGCLGNVYVHFFRQEDGAGEGAPIELTLEIVVFFHFALVLAHAGDGEHLAREGNIYRCRLYARHERFDHDGVGRLVDVYSKFAFGLIARPALIACVDVRMPLLALALKYGGVRARPPKKTT